MIGFKRTVFFIIIICFERYSSENLPIVLHITCNIDINQAIKAIHINGKKICQMINMALGCLRAFNYLTLVDEIIHLKY